MSQAAKQVDPDVWRACAGNSIQIPPLHSRVYYFPQGHLEQISRDSPPPPHVTPPPFIPCHVTKLSFLSNPTTDEVFTRITLSPKLHSLSSSNPPQASPQNVVVSFAKVLTPSDANNGGGFSVPRFCADSIFPPLDYNADPPVQNIKITDVQGHTWEFRHIYRGTPRRHLLTTGWSKFVNNKKLIAGDSVVFMRNKLTNVLYVGVRRAVRNVDLERERSAYAAYAHLVVRKEKDEKEKEREEEVVRAVERAVRGEEFEVVYYPKGVAMNGSAEFVVGAEKVEGAMRVFWRPQMRVKIAMETEDSSRMTWFQGTVSGVVVVESGAWRGTTWRMLEVCRLTDLDSQFRD